MSKREFKLGDRVRDSHGDSIGTVCGFDSGRFVAVRWDDDDDDEWLIREKDIMPLTRGRVLGKVTVGWRLRWDDGDAGPIYASRAELAKAYPSSDGKPVKVVRKVRA